MARPSKLDPEALRIKRVIAAIREGNTREASAAAGPIGVTTFYRWMRDGRANPNSPAGAFVAQVEEAEAEAERRVVAIWQAAMPTDWRACRDYLSRRYPARWGRQPPLVELVDRDGVPLAMDDLITADRARSLTAKAIAYLAEHGIEVPPESV